MSNKVSKKAGGTASSKKKMASGGSPNAGGYGKKATNYAISGNAGMKISAAKTKTAATKATSKPVTKKKAVAKKDSSYKGKGTWVKKSDGSSEMIAFDGKPTGTMARRKEETKPIEVSKMDTVLIPTSGERERIAMKDMKVKKSGGAMSKMKKMSYRKGGSKKAC